MHENLLAKVLDNLKAWTILKRNTLHKGDPKLCAHNHIDRALSKAVGKSENLEGQLKIQDFLIS